MDEDKGIGGGKKSNVKRIFLFMGKATNRPKHKWVYAQVYEFNELKANILKCVQELNPRPLTDDERAFVYNSNLPKNKLIPYMVRHHIYKFLSSKDLVTTICKLSSKDRSSLPESKNLDQDRTLAINYLYIHNNIKNMSYYISISTSLLVKFPNYAQFRKD